MDSLFPGHQGATATVTATSPNEPPLVGKSDPVLLPITVPTAGLAFDRKEHNPGRATDRRHHRLRWGRQPDLAVSSPVAVISLALPITAMSPFFW